MEVTVFRNHVLAARRRAEDYFEEHYESRSWFKQLA
jgi:hypothetical protein